jgi:hypothetical protein
MMMQFAHKHLIKVEGNSFYKLMGSGKGLGFNPLPDWSVYALLQVWENESYADKYFDSSKLHQRYIFHADEICSLYLKNISAGGKWSNKEPFEQSSSLDALNPQIAVITRATIKFSKLLKFWSYVPHSEKPLKNNMDLIFTKGIGEVPIMQMATFSLWKNIEAVKAFAYQSKAHQIAIQKTRKIQWYKEELFSRFQPYKSRGSWEGKKLLLR